LTMQGLRQQIQPVSPDVFLRFLTHHHGLTKSTRRAGVNGLFEAVSLLQGYDLAAVCWERDVLPARVDGYRSAWLDELCLSGEVAWGRLFPPKRDADSPALLTRVVPVSLFLRSDLGWLTADAALENDEVLSPAAGEILATMKLRGAVFASDLKEQLRIGIGELNDALGELVSRGRIAADGFGGLRSLLQSKQPAPSVSRRSGLTRTRNSAGNTGRWAIWHRESATADVSRRSDLKSAADEENPVEQWAWQLLRRWGVVFRDLLERESGTPRWWELLQVYRRLEARGEIRGGRFITGVAGEQFALGDTVKKLRQLRDATPDSGNRAISKTAGIREGFLSSGDEFDPRPAASAVGSETSQESLNVAASDELVIISAADPLNLVGIITRHSRVPATAHNRIAFLNGKPIAALINGEVSFLDMVRATQRDRLARSLLGQRVDFAAEENRDSRDADEQSPKSSRKHFVRPAIS
jgi:ATP-dependent Lhr-like helicase